MTTDDGERKAIEEARSALSTLTPSRLSTLHDDAIAFAVRHAYRLMDNAVARRFSRDAKLNDLRHEASVALKAVAEAYDRRTLTQDLITKARDAVAAVLAGFN